MAEIVGAFLRREGVNKRADLLPCCLYQSSIGFAAKRLEPGKDLLNGIEIWREGRQQELRDISGKAFVVDGGVKDERLVDAIVPERCQKGSCRPTASRPLYRTRHVDAEQFIGW